MLTIDELKALGADTEDGLKRCLGKEDFYLRMVRMALSDDGFERLKAAVETGNLDEGFERAHALKGGVGLRGKHLKGHGQGIPFQDINDFHNSSAPLQMNS